MKDTSLKKDVDFILVTLGALFFCVALVWGMGVAFGAFVRGFCWASGVC